jgi:serine phosphatase RsbU (regulator of sigma subunit)
MNDGGEEFGEDRLAGVLRERRGETAIGIVDAAMRALNEWRGEVTQADDVAIVVAKITA